MSQSKKRSKSDLPASFYEQLEANKRLRFNSESQEWKKSYSKINGVQCLVVTEKAKPAQTSPIISPVHSLQSGILVQTSNNSNPITRVIKVPLSSMQYDYLCDTHRLWREQTEESSIEESKIKPLSTRFFYGDTPISSRICNLRSKSLQYRHIESITDHYIYCVNMMPFLKTAVQTHSEISRGSKKLLIFHLLCWTRRWIPTMMNCDL